jgi:hypothetical protein
MSREPRVPTAASAAKIIKRCKKPKPDYDRTAYTITLTKGGTFTGSPREIVLKLKLRKNRTVIPYRLKNGMTTEAELRARPNGTRPKGKP